MIAVLGGINMDLVSLAPRFPKPGETVIGTRFVTYPGGKGANQAVACARLGAKTWMVGCVGGDMFGPQLIQALKTAGVDTSAVRVNPNDSSGIAVITIDSTAQNSIVQILGANTTCNSVEVEQVQRLLMKAEVLMLQQEVPIKVSLEAAKSAHALGRTVILDPAPARNAPPELYKHCDYITPNETEAAALVGFAVTDVPSAERAAKQLLALGVKCAIIKMGEKGAFYVTREASGFVPAFKVRAVDTVAAGDAFNGGLAVALTEGKDLDEVVRFANACGALKVTKVGAQDGMPSRKEVDAFLAQGRTR
jgi:ribokinase